MAAAESAMEDMLHEVESVRRFAGLGLSALPSAINASLASRGLKLREGTVVEDFPLP